MSGKPRLPSSPLHQSSSEIARGAYSVTHRLEAHVAKVAHAHPFSEQSRTTVSDLEEYRCYAAQCVEYQRRLASLGVPVPPLEQTIVGTLIEGSVEEGTEVSVFTVTEYAGQPLQIVSAAAPTRAVICADARDVLQAVLPVLEQERDREGRVPVGIDVQLKNFVRAARRVVYVDFTPPRFYTPEGGFRVEWPQPRDTRALEEGWKRFYMPAGILLQWLSYCCLWAPDARPLFLQLLRRHVPSPLAAELFSTFSFLRLSARSTRRAWRRAVATAVDSTELRAIACALAAPTGTHPETRSRLRTFWTRTTFLPFHRTSETLDAHRTLLAAWIQ